MIFVGIDVAKDKHDCFILNWKERSWQMYLPLPITASVLRRFFKNPKLFPR